jgi:oligoribonuclease NrnB/cAMP/cGMP phosphodiesterase (DHH superfamily)
VNYHLYFHEDFDGVAAGAVLLNFFIGRGDNMVSFTPMNYSPELKKKWASFKFKEPFVIVDFLYHPRAAWWFDHHPTSFIKAAWRETFKDDKNHAFDSTKKSACDLMAAHLKREFNYKPPKFIADLIKWAAIIDSASYKSAKEAVESKQPAIKLARAIGHPNCGMGAEKKCLGTVIESLAIESITKTIQAPAVKKELERIEKSDKEAGQIFAKISKVTGRVVFIDGTKTKAQPSIFLGYYFYPKIDYAMTLESYVGYYHLVVGKNPWKNVSAKVHIGEVLSKYGGGGHKTIGGVERKTKPEILKIAEEIIECLNKPPHHNR